MNKLMATLVITGLSQAAAAQDHKNPMELMDTDNNGTISFAEFQENSSDLLTRVDADGDGQLSLDEFLSQRSKRGQRPDGQGRKANDGDESQKPTKEERVERMTMQFQEMDLNGDEVISLLEFQEASFLRMDRDNNGALDASELRPPRGARQQGKRGEKPNRTA